MRRISRDDSFDGTDGGEAHHRSRVTRLVDLLEGEATPKRPPSCPSAPVAEEDGGRRRTRTAPPPSESPSSPTILSVIPEGEGDLIAVVMALPPCGSFEGDMAGGTGVSTADAAVGAAKKPRRVKLFLLVEQYAELRAAGVPLECGDISEEQVSLLTEAGELCAAIRRGMAVLQYGDRSARRLTQSLTAKGVSRERAEAAADYLTRKGYIREEDTARRRVGGDLRKGWGPRRIREDLRAQGLEAEAVDRAMEELSEVDFRELCAEVIQKKYGGLPSEREERKKMTAALMRLGYDLDHIRGASRLLARETP